MLIGVQSRARSHARAPAEVYPAQPNAGSAGFYAVCDDTVRREASLVMAGPMIYHVQCVAPLSLHVFSLTHTHTTATTTIISSASLPLLRQSSLEC